jgi:hypothetical protein
MAELRWIDTSRPEKWICVLPSRLTLEEFVEEFGEAMESLRRLPPGRRLVVLTDLAQLAASDSRRRQRAAQFIRENKAVLRRHVVAWGFVAAGVMRGALTAIGWLHAFPVPMSVFATREECERWLEARLANDIREGGAGGEHA